MSALQSMTRTREPVVEAATRLHYYLWNHCWEERALIGPDPGVRFNYRIGRFVKSCLPAVRWNDDYYYLQGQGYWVLGNWSLFALTGLPMYEELARKCSTEMLARQRADGAWDYPNPEWKGRVATAEGTWAAIGLLASYRQTAERAFLDGALRWERFLTDTIGFSRIGDEVAVNYFAGRGDARVPNNSAFVLRFLAELAEATGDTDYLAPCAGMLTFLQHVQQPNGEFPYEVAGTTAGKNWLHFQCIQYNAFQCLDLIRYCELTGDSRSRALVARTLEFLRTGQDADGHAFYACEARQRRVTYHTAVLAAAFAQAGVLGISGYEEPARRAYAYLLLAQQPDGRFVYSQGDYRVLSDWRSYPRYLAMILYHLLQEQTARAAHQARPALTA